MYSKQILIIGLLIGILTIPSVNALQMTTLNEMIVYTYTSQDGNTNTSNSLYYFYPSTNTINIINDTENNTYIWRIDFVSTLIDTDINPTDIYHEISITSPNGYGASFSPRYSGYANISGSYQLSAMYELDLNLGYHGNYTISERDVAYIDSNHNGYNSDDNPTVNYYNFTLQFNPSDSVIIYNPIITFNFESNLSFIGLILLIGSLITFYLIYRYESNNGSKFKGVVYGFLSLAMMGLVGYALMVV